MLITVDVFASVEKTLEGIYFPLLVKSFSEPEYYKYIKIKVRKKAKLRNRYNQVPHLTQDTNGKVTNSQLDITNERQEVSPFIAGDLVCSSRLRFSFKLII